MLDRTSKRVAQWLCRNEAISSEELELYQYAVLCVIIKFIPFIIIMVWGIISKNIVNSFVICTVFIWVRRYSGGYHAKTPYRCLVMSVTIMIGSILASNYICDVNGLLLAALTIIEIGLLLHLAPVDCKNKRLSDNEKKYLNTRLRIVSGLLIMIYMVSYLFSLDIVNAGIQIALFLVVIMVIVSKVTDKHADISRESKEQIV